MDSVQPRNLSDMIIISYMGLGSSVRCKTLVSLYFGLCGKREMVGSLKINGGHQRCCGIYFTFIPPLLRPLLSTILKTCLSTSFSSISTRCVDQKANQQ